MWSQKFKIVVFSFRISNTSLCVTTVLISSEIRLRNEGEITKRVFLSFVPNGRGDCLYSRVR